jgi:hypothetical protein
VDEDGDTFQADVLATVVEEQVAVGGGGHVRERDPVLAEGVLDRSLP